jgi:acyl carrier protein
MAGLPAMVKFDLVIAGKLRARKTRGMSEVDTTPVRGFIVDNFLYGEDSGFTESTSLLEEGILDSTGILQLVTFIETTFSIHVKDEELVPENLDSLQNIAAYLARKRAAEPC